MPIHFFPHPPASVRRQCVRSCAGNPKVYESRYCNPATQEAVIHVEDTSHPATQHVSGTWTRRDEWYDFRENPRDRVNVLLSLDTDSFEGSRMGDDHPIAWYHEFDGGRALYTGFGHTHETFAEEDALAHLLGAIQWAAGRAEVSEQGRKPPFVPSVILLPFETERIVAVWYHTPPGFWVHPAPPGPVTRDIEGSHAEIEAIQARLVSDLLLQEAGSKAGDGASRDYTRCCHDGHGCRSFGCWWSRA